MILVLMNNTASAIVIDDTGATVPGSGTYIIQPQDLPLWAASADIDPELTSGDLTLERDTVTLSADDAKELIHRLRILKVLEDSSLIKRDVLSIDFEGFTVTDTGYGSVKVQQPGESSLEVVVGASSTVSLETTPLTGFCSKHYQICLFNTTEDKWKALQMHGSKRTATTVRDSVYSMVGDMSLNLNLEFKVVATDAVLEAVNNESFPVTVRYRVETT